MADREVQRRLAAVLCADIAGYTRLMEDDTDGTVAAWHKARAEVIDPEIAKRNGRIVKHTGDGFLAEFPTVQDAVECAVTLQHGLSTSPLEFRIGVNLGDIIDDGEDIHGEGVNVAARLEGLAEPGGVCISASVYEQVRNRLDYEYTDLGEKEVKHVSAPVRVFAVQLSAEAKTADIKAALDKPSIAILPFNNLSGDPEQEYFSDGISEDLITGLSHIRQFHVVARNTTFTFKGRSVDVAAIAKELGVRYVLEGSVRKSGNRVRITAQLINGETGNHIWAERYDRDLEDVFEVQDDIVSTVIGAMGHEINLAEQERALMKPPENLDAWELHHRGMAQLFKRTVDGNVEARRFFEAAIERDPSFAGPHAGTSRSYSTDKIFGIPNYDHDLALQFGKRAVELDNRDAGTHLALGLAYWIVERDYGSAIRAMEEARRISPNDAQILHGLGRALMASGRAGDALPYLREATQLSPSDMMFGIFCTGLAFAHLFLGDHEQAVEWGQNAWQKLPPRSYLWVEMASLPAALAYLDRFDEARQELAKLVEVRPDLSIDLIRERTLTTHPDYLDHLCDGLRKAGLAEH